MRFGEELAASLRSKTCAIRFRRLVGRAFAMLTVLALGDAEQQTLLRRHLAAMRTTKDVFDGSAKLAFAQWSVSGHANYPFRH